MIYQRAKNDVTARPDANEPEKDFDATEMRKVDSLVVPTMIIPMTTRTNEADHHPGGVDHTGAETTEILAVSV